MTLIQDNPNMKHALKCGRLSLTKVSFKKTAGRILKCISARKDILSYIVYKLFIHKWEKEIMSHSDEKMQRPWATDDIMRDSLELQYYKTFYDAENTRKLFFWERGECIKHSILLHDSFYLTRLFRTHHPLSFPSLRKSYAECHPRQLDTQADFHNPSFRSILESSRVSLLG